MRSSAATAIVWLTALLTIARQSGASDVTGQSAADDVTGLTSPADDVLHVHLHNASHGELRRDGAVHEVHSHLLVHNSSHSVLHLNSSSGGLHKDVLVSNDVVDGMDLGFEPVNRSHTRHHDWSGHEELVATADGWISSPLSNVTVDDREAAMAAADGGHRSGVHLFAAVMGACAGVVLVGGVGFWLLRGRPHGDAALLGEEDEEFTVFSVVDHPYPGKKRDNYAPLH